MYHVVGTTCATVLTQAILTEGCKPVSAGVNVMDLRSGINIAVGAVLSDLKRRALMISTPEEITQPVVYPTNLNRLPLSLQMVNVDWRNDSKSNGESWKARSDYCH